MKKLFVFITFLCTGLIASGQALRQPVSVIYQPGYINVNELAAGFGLGETAPDYSKYFYGLTSAHGYQFNIPGSRAGSIITSGGAGMLFYNGGPLFPLFGDVRLRFTRKRISPFLFARGGLLVNLGDMKGESRVFANGGGGVYISIDNKMAISVGPGLYIQKGKDIPKDSFVGVNVGVVFKPGIRRMGTSYSVQR